MSYEKVYGMFEELKKLLLAKKEAIIHKDLEMINQTDEQCNVLCGQIKKTDLENIKNNFSENQKQELKKLGKEIKSIQNGNEILIKHALNVINNLLSGMLNIIQTKSQSYNEKGMSAMYGERLDISSIVEEA